MLSNRLWAIGGGKGGTGKSFLTASMSIALAQMGRAVIAVDASYGSPNLHTCLGIRSPGRTLLDVLEEKSSVEAALIPTSEPGLHLLACTGDSIGTADLDDEIQKEMLALICGLGADHVLADLASGASAQVLDFFNAAGQSIIVASPEPGSIQRAYAFLRNALYRRLEREFGAHDLVRTSLRQLQKGRAARQPTVPDVRAALAVVDETLAQRFAAAVAGAHSSLVLNMAASEQDHRTAAILQSAVKQTLGTDLKLAGIISTDSSVRQAAQRMVPLDLESAGSAAAHQIRETVRNLLNGPTEVDAAKTDSEGNVKHASPTLGINENLEFLGRRLHVQTEDLGAPKKVISTQVFLNGRVIHSTRSQYPESKDGDNPREQIAELMRLQHHAVISEIQTQKARFSSP